jgi:hypothetical protein
MSDPTPEEQRRLLAWVPADTAVALRLLAAFVEGDLPAATSTIDEISASPRAMNQVSSLCQIASRLAFELAERVGGGDASGWVHAMALAVLDDVEQLLGDGQ